MEKNAWIKCVRAFFHRTSKSSSNFSMEGIVCKRPLDQASFLLPDGEQGGHEDRLHVANASSGRRTDSVSHFPASFSKTTKNELSFESLCQPRCEVFVLQVSESFNCNMSTKIVKQFYIQKKFDGFGDSW